jgi:chemotaxis protein MotB
MRQPFFPERAGPDRWLISYADLVTLLFACFSTAYAASYAQGTATPVQKPAEQAVIEPVVAPPVIVPGVLTEPMKEARHEEIPLRDVLAPILASTLGTHNVEFIEDARGLVISIRDLAAFASGSADLTTDAQTFLRQLAEQLRESPAFLQIEGHTDDVPISTGRYRSNWELSTARASEVVVFLITETSFDPSRLSAAGYGEFHPKVTNDSAENRALNRRVDIVVIEPADAEGVGPAS